MQPSADITDLAPFVTLLHANGTRQLFEQVLENGAAPGRLAFAVSHVAPVTGKAVSIAKLERHPDTTQSFLPLAVGRWLLVVAPSRADGSPDLAKARAAIARQGHAICIERNVWHATLTVLDREAEIAMIMWRNTSGIDTLYADLAVPLVVDIETSNDPTED